MVEQKIYKLENTIQDYAWGTRNVLNQLFSIPNPSNKPQAEIWMGAHPKASSTVLVDDSTRVPLIDFIRRDPIYVLGSRVSETFDGMLPFLFKVLSAAAPLSIQAHPGRVQAKTGFERETAAGIDISAPIRNYKDPFHKPELVVAVTPFKALKGFREIPEIVTLFEYLDIPEFKPWLKKLSTNPDTENLRAFYTWLMKLNGKKKNPIIEQAVMAAGEGQKNPAFRELINLHSFYHGDIGIFCALLLNLVVLKPGEAMYLGEGVLHAYIEGTAMEIMANSDNVLRGGLTPKHVDVNELLSILSFETGKLDILTPTASQKEGETFYTTPADEFFLSVICLAGNCNGDSYISDSERSVEILFCSSGRGKITIMGEENGISMIPGESYLVPAAVPQYKITGNVTIYKASVPGS
jgi:mannose-6-phosphate isomerase